jgi:serine/threonine protein kinase
VSSSDIEAALAPEFEVLRPLGEGTVGSVYLAREVALQRLVAVKVPRKELASDEMVRRRFEREARAAARLSHPNVAAVYRVGRLPDGTPYLVMEYLDGRTLAESLAAGGALDQDPAIHVLHQVADALACAHAENVIHRDVRPDNVIWNPDPGRAVLTDFGIAGILETGSEVITRITRAGEVLGDPPYASPEQLMGEHVTAAADIYSLAVLGYEILTLQRPYRATSLRELTAAHLRQPPRELSELLPDVDRDLDALLRRCLNKEPRHRPRAAEVARQLAQIEAARAGTGPGKSGESGSDLVDAALENFPALHGFVRELIRRRVVGVAVIYLAAAFVLLQGAQAILPELPVSDWAYRALVALTLAGFPLTLVLSWVFDVTSTGIHRTAATAAPAGARYRMLFLKLLGLTLSFILSGLIGWWVLRK